MTLQVGKRYVGKFTKQVLTITGLKDEVGFYPGKYANGKDAKVTEGCVSELEDEDYAEETVMKVKIGDKITLKKWDNIDHSARIPAPLGVKVHPIKGHKEIYDEKTPLEVISLPGNNVVNIKLPPEAKEFFPFWEILVKDIYEILGRSKQEKKRIIRGVIKQEEIEDKEEKELQEFEINFGEKFILKINGEDPIKISIGHSHIYKDAQLSKGQKRIELTGIVYPEEKSIRLIRR